MSRVRGRGRTDKLTSRVVVVIWGTIALFLLFVCGCGAPGVGFEAKFDEVAEAAEARIIEAVREVRRAWAVPRRREPALARGCAFSCVVVVVVVVAVEVEGGPAFLVLVLPLAPGVLICGRREDGLSLSFGVCGRASAGSAARGRRMGDEREAGAGEDAMGAEGEEEEEEEGEDADLRPASARAGCFLGLGRCEGLLVAPVPVPAPVPALPELLAPRVLGGAAGADAGVAGARTFGGDVCVMAGLGYVVVYRRRGGGGGCERASERASKWATGCGGRGGRGVAVGRATALLVVCWWLLEAGSGTPRRVRHGGFIGQGSGRVWTLGRHMRSARPPSANNPRAVASPQRPSTSL